MQSRDCQVLQGDSEDKEIDVTVVKEMRKEEQIFHL
jgi:hypothetical protein